MFLAHEAATNVLTSVLEYFRPKIPKIILALVFVIAMCSGQRHRGIFLQYIPKLGGVQSILLHYSDWLIAKQNPDQFLYVCGFFDVRGRPFFVEDCGECRSSADFYFVELVVSFSAAILG